MIRVLHITEQLSAAGIESFIMNMYRHVDRDKVQFDFLVLRNQEEFYDEEINGLGGKKYNITSKLKNTYFRILHESIQLKKFLKKHNYNIVHIHYTTPLRAPYLYAAKKAGVEVRIYHAHSAAVLGKSKLKVKIYDYYKKKISKWGTDWFACSKAAADWIFEKKMISSNRVKVVYNGIDTEKFKYIEDSRREIRKELNIENNFVVIHTGRFIEQKNQSFILDIFYELKEKCQNAKLLLLGTGDMMQEIKEKAKLLNISSDVLFLGVKPNVEQYLCAADCYLMPSLYEGLPVAVVEAECTGLPCVLSTNITEEVKMTNNTEFHSLQAPINEWVEAVSKAEGIYREDKSAEISNCGYDVRLVSKWLENFYLSK